MLAVRYDELSLEFETNESVFSPKGLDAGTKAMLKEAVINDQDRILDLGCGYGFVGIYLAKKYPDTTVTMTDISANAIDLTTKNAQRNEVAPEIVLSEGFREISDKTFGVILSNPPYHVDFSVPKEFIEQAYRQLALNGKLYMVTKRRKWYENKIRSIFGYVKVTEVDDYYVFYAEKRAKKPLVKKKEKKMSKKLQRKYGKR
ncbi:methyltransferase [Enterococcus casseliflavus]|uniref:class I SAM-dependent methyltransferase n=1 Tax=Enterococcus casseliflavus TaxID=37734 RepID=UPI0009BEF0B7|nr:methyltransferase [Enterococcus casseliflavus]OQO87954.1 methyltransferase [Enterococcus casseliflavus]